MKSSTRSVRTKCGDHSLFRRGTHKGVRIEVGTRKGARCRGGRGTGALIDTTYAGYWFDGLGRSVAAADWGTNGGTAMDVDDRPSAAPTASTFGMLVTRSADAWADFDSDGDIDFISKSTDTAGRESWSIADSAGRTVQTIQNYVDGDPVSWASDL